MRLCMFTPRELALERGWPGRIDGDVVVQLAAQTLEAFFSGGGKAREHNLYPLADVGPRQGTVGVDQRGHEVDQSLEAVHLLRVRR